MSTDDDFPGRLLARLDALAPAIEVDTSGVIAGARRRRRGTLIGSAATILLVASGVAWAAAATPGVAPEPADGTFINGWQRPAWMDEEAELRAEYYAAFQACVDAKGLDYTVDDPNDALSTRDTEKLQGVLDCQAQLGGDPFDWTATDDSAREFYGRQVDVAQCLSHLGFDIDVPLTEEEWLGEVRRLLAVSGAPVWVAWRAYPDDPWMYSTDANMFIDDPRVVELCPEPWPALRVNA